MKDVLFIFNEKLYKQINGVAMGSLLGPTLANIFLGYHERRWLDNCPPTFKPVLYRRYIDDTFLLLRHESHIQNFLNYLNSQHQSIEFTCETENNCKLNFLNITIHRNLKFETSEDLFRKKSFTNFGMKFNSCIPNLYKNNLIPCLIFRVLEFPQMNPFLLENWISSKCFSRRIASSIRLFKNYSKNLYKIFIIPNHNVALSKGSLFSLICLT